MGERKTCCKCKSEKFLVEFYAASGRPDGRQSRCIACTKVDDKLRPPRPHTPERRDRYYRETYDLSLEQVEQMKVEQGGMCAICHQPPRRWVVDHCHDSNIVRGLLCDTCNRSLGLLKDDVDVLMSAVSYLLAHSDVLATAGGGHHG